MDRSISKKITLISLLSLLVSAGIFAQTPSIVQHIRFPIWAEVDAYPGLELPSSKDASAQDNEENSQENKNTEYDYAISRIKEIVPFLMNGMVYGWEFRYTPSDKSRGVEEYLEVELIQNLEKETNPIVYSSPWIEDNKFNCWVDYTRTEFQIRNYYLWSQIKNPGIQGRGKGSLELGFDGIKAAAEEALINAIRSYYRNTIKNKPKEIQGKVLIRKIPTIGITSGQYVINLDFFLECGKIKQYSQF